MNSGPQAPAETVRRDLTSDRYSSLRPGVRRVVTAISIASCLFHLYVLILAPMAPWIFRSAHLTFALVITFCVVPMRKAAGGAPSVFVDIVLICSSLAVMGYIAQFHEEMAPRASSCSKRRDGFPAGRS